MVDAETVARQYIELWNETVPQRRAQLLATQWDENATYTDPMARGSGLQAIDALIRDVHARFSGYRFKLITPGRGFSEFVRFSWSLGPSRGEAPIEGSDVLVMKGGRIRDVIGFLDKVPQ